VVDGRAPLASISGPYDQRVTITADVPEYGPEGRRLLSLVEDPEARVWHAVDRLDGHFAGRAWAFARMTSLASTTWTRGHAFDVRV
jgi:hypothetical protein